MTKSCAVKDCHHNSSNNNSVNCQGHQHFPTDERLIQWVKVTGQENLVNESARSLNRNYVICFCHFQQKDFVTTTTGKLKLITSAIPTLKLPANFIPDEAITKLTFKLSTPSTLETTKNCEVNQCHHNSVNKDANNCLGYQHFPTDNDKLIQWVRATGTDDLVNKSRRSLNRDHVICFCHFEHNDLVINGHGKLKIKESAIPTLKLPINAVKEELMTKFISKLSTPLKMEITKNCVVKDCNHSSLNKDAENCQGFQHFPADHRLTQWVKATGQENLVNESLRSFHKKHVICFCHFNYNHFEITNTGNIKLKTSAIPTLKLPMKLITEEVITELTSKISTPMLFKMTKNCAVKECCHNSINKETENCQGYQYFPTDQRLIKWIQATGHDDLVNESFRTLNREHVICFCHFQQNDFVVTSTGNKKLKASAIPTLKLPAQLVSEELLSKLTSRLASPLSTSKLEKISSKTISQGILKRKSVSPGPVIPKKKIDKDTTLGIDQENNDPNQTSPELEGRVNPEDTSISNELQSSSSNSTLTAPVKLDWIIDGTNSPSHCKSIAMKRRKIYRSYTRFTKYVGSQLRMIQPSKARIAMLKINKILNHFVTLQLNKVEVYNI